MRLAVVVFGAALPLFAGALQTHGEDAASESLIKPTTDFTKPEPGEDKPGGGATSRGSTATPNAFSLSSGNMDFKRELEFKVGNGIFRKNWISAPSSTDASDGLGPLFNSRACQNCHLKDGRGHPQLSADVADDSGSMLIRLSVPPATDRFQFLPSLSNSFMPVPAENFRPSNSRSRMKFVTPPRASAP